MNQWAMLPGQPVQTQQERPIFSHGGKFFTYVSCHPLEERIVELTDDYRTDDGDFLEPEVLAWDGVETCPGIVIG